MQTSFLTRAPALVFLFSHGLGAEAGINFRLQVNPEF